MMKKSVSMILAVMILFVVSMAAAKTIEPEETEIERLAGATLHATVGEYDTDLRTFEVALYADDRFDADDIAKLAAGDILLAGGWLYTVKEMTTAPDGEPMAVTEDGYEIVFIPADDDDLFAQSTDDDRRYMSVFAVLNLPAAAGIIYEDDSDPEVWETMVTEGLDEILKIKAEKEETSIGFDYYATEITLNEKLEIVKIHQYYDVAQ